jgi:uncharacterized protein
VARQVDLRAAHAVRPAGLRVLADLLVEAAEEVAVVAAVKNRFGIGWRPDLAAGILAHLDRIDVIEVMGDDYFDAGARELSALKTLAAQVSVTLHGVSMGLASTMRAETRRIDQMARLLAQIRPESWSEHLAFVRGGGVEIGHLAAPPRNAGTVEATAENVARAEAIVGVRPMMENIASLIDPPGSVMDEAAWLSHTLRETGVPLLLDLHNVYVNGLNFGFDPLAFLDRVPLQTVGAIHLSGGKWIGDAQTGRRMLDDHLHDVPDPVYDLLTRVAAKTQQPLTVILERDGNYPPMRELLGQLDLARNAVLRGREKTYDIACV